MGTTDGSMVGGRDGVRVVGAMDGSLDDASVGIVDGSKVGD